MTLVATTNGAGMPDMSVSVRQVFGIDSDLEVPAYSLPDAHGSRLKTLNRSS